MTLSIVRPTLALAAALPLVLAACADGPLDTSAAPPEKRPQLALTGTTCTASSCLDMPLMAAVRTYANVRAGSGDEIVLITPGGSVVARLTNDAAKDAEPALSPDRQWVAFVSERDGGGIYVVNVDGTRLRRVVSAKGYDRMIAWSPDGKRLAYTASVGFTNSWDLHELYVINVDGTGQTQLTNDQKHDGSPVFTRDGSRVIFLSEGRNMTYTFATGARAELSGATDWEGRVAISPDGTRIAVMEYHTESVPGGWGGLMKNETVAELVVRDLAGGNRVKLFSTFDNVGLPTFSPDGKTIAYSFDYGSAASVRRIAATGGASTAVTDATHGDAPTTSPSWTY